MSLQLRHFLAINLGSAEVDLKMAQELLSCELADHARRLHANYLHNQAKGANNRMTEMVSEVGRRFSALL